jgi:hypothetical protein
MATATVESDEEVEGQATTAMTKDFLGRALVTPGTNGKDFLGRLILTGDKDWLGRGLVT